MSNRINRVVGFTLGCFDLFHIGHINLLRNARALCDTLIVGVCSDEYMTNNKREPIYALNDRMEILKACKYCDVVVPEDTLEKVELYNKYKDMDAETLNSTLFSEVARQKSNGTFDYQKLESMLEGMKDALGETNYQNMKRILESLK